MAGEISYTQGMYARWRHRLSLVLSGTRWKWTGTLRTISSADVTEALCDEWAPTKSVPTVNYVDTAGSFSVSMFYLVVGIDNLLDTQPPYLPEGFQNANSQTYDFIGRFFYGRLGLEF